MPDSQSRPIDTEWVRERFGLVLGLAGIGPDADFFELGGDSPAAVVLMNEIEATTGRLYPIETLVSAPTPRKLAAHISADAGAAPHGDLLLPVATEGERTPLFLIHGLHGQIYVAGYLRGLVAGRPIWGIGAAPQDPDRAEPKSIAQLADDYLAAIRSVRPNGPYVLAGYCAGTFIAWEMAWRLRASGETVPLVLAIDPPPFFGDLIGGGHGGDPLYERNFRDKALKDFRNAANVHMAFAWIRDNERALDAAVRTASALRQAFLEYRPRPYDGPVVFLCSRNKGQLIARPGSAWRPLVNGDIEIETIADLHLGLFLPSNSTLAQSIDRVLRTRDL